MRLRRATRTGAVIAATLGALASFMPSASAEGVGTVVFVGTATLNAGLDYPCAETANNIVTKTNPTKTITTLTAPENLTGAKGDKDCPPHATPTGTVSKKGKPFDIDGNTRTGTFAAIACVGVAVNGPDKNKTTTQGPGCGIAAAFTVTGYCGLSQGAGAGTATIAGQVINFNFTWFDVAAGQLVILGNWSKANGDTGDLVSTVRAVPPPALPGQPPNSCTDKTAKNFVIVGAALLVHPKTLP